MPIEPGAEATVEHVVTEADTALSLGSGDVSVLGTPAVVALCERAAVESLRLDIGQTSVGTNVTIDHLAPTAVGRRVVARARLDAVEGRKLRFSIEASDPAGVIARGTHVRVIVDRARFAADAAERN